MVEVVVEVEVEVEVTVEDAGAEWDMVAPKVWSLEEYGGPAVGADLGQRRRRFGIVLPRFPPPR